MLDVIPYPELVMSEEMVAHLNNLQPGLITADFLSLLATPPLNTCCRVNGENEKFVHLLNEHLEATDQNFSAELGPLSDAVIIRHHSRTVESPVGCEYVLVDLSASAAILRGEI